MKKLLTVFGAVGLAAASFAAIDDTLISFSTPGVDTYADGTVVKDGECYALVWSKDGVFEGIDVNGAPLDANDKVVLVAPVAKDGKCPTLIYQVDADLAAKLAGGQYGVYLLDTRRTATTGETVVGLEDGELAFVRSIASATDAGSVAADGTPSAIAAKDAVGGAAATVFAEVAAPAVAIKVDAATVKLTVSGMNPFAAYWVQKGTDIKDISEKVADVPADGEVTLPKTDAAAFFTVKGGIPAAK